MGEPKIVLLDLETLVDLNAALEFWPQLSNYPGLTLKAQLSSIICAGWKVFGSEKKSANCINAWDFPSWKKDVNDDRALCEALSEVLRDADCVVTHNGRRFDWKFLQTRLLRHGLPLLPKIHHVDTKVLASSNFYFFNNRLNTIAKFLKKMEKREHDGWDLWVRVHGRDRSAQAEMEKYCKQDVLVLEEIFRELRPTAKLPNYNLFDPLAKRVCPSCGSSRLKSNGRVYTRTRTYRRYRCQDCRSWCHTDLKDELPR